MKFLILDTYYPGFLRSFRAKRPGLSNKPYREQLKTLSSQCFGTSDYYSFNLKALGHRAEDVILNDEVLQRRWAEEHGVMVRGHTWYSRLQSLPFVHRYLGRPQWMQEVALAQIKAFRPDILYIQDLSALNPRTLRTARDSCKLIVGQIASPLPAEENLRFFDLILTSFPHYVARFRKMGIRSEYFKIAFEPRVLKRVGRRKRVYDIGFIGSFSPHHSSGTKFLEAVAAQIPVHIWGHGLQFLSPASPLRKDFHGEAWGIDMYEILAHIKIVLNRHIDVAEDFANNMRLYESTGMGAMLMTDAKKNLGDLFRVGKEVVAYADPNDLLKKIGYYLAHEGERQRIAAAGQRRTLREHTYKKRMMELVRIVRKYL